MADQDTGHAHRRWGRIAGVAVTATLTAALVIAAASPAAAVTGYATDTAVNVRSGTTTGTSLLVQLPAHTALDITCQRVGQNINGSTIWDYLAAYGGYVSDALVDGTPYARFDPRIPQCQHITVGVPTYVRTATNRSSASTVVGTLPPHSSVSITCQAYGETVSGMAGAPGTSAIWDQIPYGGVQRWISDLMVTDTSYAVPTPGIPLCAGSAPAPGAGETARDESALQWAVAHNGQVIIPGSTVPWSGYCQLFIGAAYRATGTAVPSEPTALYDYNQHNARGLVHQGVPPRGALVFYSSTSSAGHIAFSLGGGMVISTIGEGGNRYPIAEHSYTAFKGYLGWAYAYWG